MQLLEIIKVFVRKVQVFEGLKKWFQPGENHIAPTKRNGAEKIIKDSWLVGGAVQKVGLPHGQLIKISIKR